MKDLVRRASILFGLALLGAPGWGEVPSQGFEVPFQGFEGGQLYLLHQASSDIRVRGTSTVNRWACVQNTLGGLIAVDLDRQTLLDRIAGLLEESSESGEGLSNLEGDVDAEIWVQVDAKGLDCNNGRIKKDLLEAIRAKAHPTIDYHFEALVEAPKLGRDEHGKYLEVKSRGMLSVGGKDRKTEHMTEVRLEGAASIELKGQINLRMSDYDIEPPTAFFGLVRADNSFQVEYHIVIDTHESVLVSSLPQVP